MKWIRAPDIIRLIPYTSEPLCLIFAYIRTLIYSRFAGFNMNPTSPPCKPQFFWPKNYLTRKILLNQTIFLNPKLFWTQKLFLNPLGSFLTSLAWILQIPLDLGEFIFWRIPLEIGYSPISRGIFSKFLCLLNFIYLFRSNWEMAG